MIGTGIYVDDIAAAMWRNALRLGAGTAGVVIMVLGAVFGIGRSITRPLSRLTTGMKVLATGDTSQDVAFRNRRDEIGEMARAVEVFKTNAIEKRRLEAEQEEVEAPR